MKPKPSHKIIGSIGIFIVALLTLTFLGACKNPFVTDEKEEKRASGTSPATPPPAKISFENEQAILTLDQQTQSRLGLEITTLNTTVTRAQVTVPAVVLSVQELATFRNSYIATISQIEK